MVGRPTPWVRHGCSAEILQSYNCLSDPRVPCVIIEILHSCPFSARAGFRRPPTSFISPIFLVCTLKWGIPPLCFIQMLASRGSCATFASGSLLLHGGAILCAVMSLTVEAGANSNIQDQLLVSSTFLFWVVVQHMKMHVCNTQTLLHNNISHKAQIGFDI